MALVRLRCVRVFRDADRSDRGFLAATDRGRKLPDLGTAFAHRNRDVRRGPQGNG